MNKAIVKWIKIVVMRTLKEKNLTRLDVNTLISAGMLGYSQSLKRFDPGRKVKFKTFAEYRIKGAVLDEVRKMIGDERAKNPRPKILTDFDYTVLGDDGKGEQDVESSIDLQIFMQKAPLTLREREVLQCRLEGMNLREISARFEFSESRASQVLAHIKEVVFLWYRDSMDANFQLVIHACPSCAGQNCVANLSIRFKCEFCDAPLTVREGTPILDAEEETGEVDDSEV